MKKQREELEEYWNDQLDYLKRSIDYFDQGHETEARRIANSLRIILHDTKTSHSLVKQLHRNIVYFSSSYFYTPSNLLPTWTLLQVQSIIKNGNFVLKYLPNLDFPIGNQRLFFMTFEDWWNEIIFDDKNNVFTRRDIVLFVANTDGGAHVDPDLKESFALLTKYNSLGISDLNGTQPQNNPIYQAIRVIAEEFLISVNDCLSGLKTRICYKERQFEMRFVDRNRRYKWSTTEMNYSQKTMEIVSKHKVQSRKLYRQDFGNGKKVEYIGL
jgi:hypothetical protein